MQRIPLLILTFIIAITAAGISVSPQETARPPSVAELDMLDNDFKQCMNHKSCTVQQGLRILDEMTDDMHGDLQRIEQDCKKTGYKNCFNPAAGDVIQWHKMHDRMGDMAGILEQKYTAANATGKQLNLIEPAAGPVPTPNPYTNPDHEELNKDKQDWWHGEGWTPPEEDNPYHKW
jgi:hypothetical protein